MSVSVAIPTVLRPYTGGQREVTGCGADVSELIHDLDRRHAGLSDRLLADGNLRRFVNVYRNDEDVRFLDGLATPLTDGDVVTILPAVAGG